ncbi:MAG TPA: discoidin domain-containing protein [Terriglobia bacterium]|nr:discoidin domain-containing protein [Terriglobia bacterium]
MKNPPGMRRGRISRRRFLKAGGAAALSAIPGIVQGARESNTGDEPAKSIVQDSSPNTVTVDATPSHIANSFSPHRALGTSIDILPYGSVDKLYVEPTIKRCLSAGWGPMTYRQNTELQIAAWHWNHNGTWSDPSPQSGYFTGSSEPTEFLRHSYAYPLPHRGNTRNGGTTHGYSRLTDGDAETYWKSNPYLTSRFTGEDDSIHPQWIVIDLVTAQGVNAVRIDWANPYAQNYEVQFWTGENAMDEPTAGDWNTFPNGIVTGGRGGANLLKLSSEPIEARFLRIVMTKSSNTCGTHGASDPRNCVGYAIHEVFAGAVSNTGGFVDLIQHSPDQNQTPTYCSSIDPWHSASDLDVHAGDQTGFDLFFASGVTNQLPAIIPIAMLYGIPEDAAAEIAYLKKRGYPVAYVEMGEEPDGQYAMPEDYAALYLQFATAIHGLVPEAKMGGPIFQGVNEDIKVWPDSQGRTSWLGRFLDYLKARGRMSDLAFMSFEHYPFEPCAVTWSDLYREPELVSHILDVWREDGLPDSVPMLITESNLSWGSDQSFVDMFGALWLADYAGAFLTAGGGALYYFQFFPEQLSHGCHGEGIFGMSTATADYEFRQYTSQYFAARLINTEWVAPGDKTHRLFRASCDAVDGSDNRLVTVYAVERPDGQWSLLLVNRDQENAHAVRAVFRDRESGGRGFFSGPVTMITFGREQYHWHANGQNGHADPDGPSVSMTISAVSDTTFTLPKASLTVLHGEVKGL